MEADPTGPVGLVLDLEDGGEMLERFFLTFLLVFFRLLFFLATAALGFNNVVERVDIDARVVPVVPVARVGFVVAGSLGGGGAVGDAVGKEVTVGI